MGPIGVPNESFHIGYGTLIRNLIHLIRKNNRIKNK